MDRRQFIQGLGAATGLMLGGSAAAQSLPRASRKMIIRADDIGLSKIANVGTFEAIDGGMISAADVMLDSPGTDEALARLKRYPWLSIGWHMHMWGTPVLPARDVPSLVEKGGPFDGRFRTDLARSPDVVADEAVRELRAQLERCRRVLGKVPDTAGGTNSNTPWTRSVRQVLDEYRVAHDISATMATPPRYAQHIHDAQGRGEEWAKYYSGAASPASPADPKWASRRILSQGGTLAFMDLLTDSVASVEKNYDPVLFYTEDRSGILQTPADVITWQAWHPGYIDYHAYRLGERVNRARAQQFVVGRVQDVAAMTDPRLRAWIKANGIELVNFRDALYGTREFQNHLKAIGSDLAVA